MKVSVYFYVGDDSSEFEYFSKFNRINAKGLKEEAKNEIYKKFGSYIGKNAEIENISRI